MLTLCTTRIMPLLSALHLIHIMDTIYQTCIRLHMVIRRLICNLHQCHHISTISMHNIRHINPFHQQILIHRLHHHRHRHLPQVEVMSDIHKLPQFPTINIIHILTTIRIIIYLNLITIIILIQCIQLIQVI